MIYKFFVKMLNEEADNMNDEDERNFLNLINKYLLFLFLLFLFYSLFIILVFRDIIVSTFLTGITLFWIFLIFLRGKTGKLKKILNAFIIFVFLLLTFIVSFFHIYTFKKAGVEYFYFSLLFSIPFFFDYREKRFSIFLVAVIVCINFIGCLYFEFECIPRSIFLKAEDFRTVQLLNILFSVTTFLMGIFFVTRKDILIYGLIEDTKSKETTIEDLLKANDELMRLQLMIHHLTEEDIQEIFNLAESNSPLFFDKFQVFFPEFIPVLLEIAPNLIHSELYYCALMKLDFDTKKIAQCTNSSVRAVESKKYRIRKKLNISSEININSFILKI